jgi:nodulation protein E
MNRSGPRRVAITGMGVVSAIGSGLTAYAAALRNCRSGIAQRTAFDETYAGDFAADGLVQLAAAVADVPPGLVSVDEVPDLELDRFAAFAVMATRDALADAGIAAGDPRRMNAAAIVGTAVGGDLARDLTSQRVYVRRQRPHPMSIARTMVNAGASAVSMAFGLRGPAFDVSSACASGAHAIGQAFRMLQSGDAELAVAGGAESLPGYSLFRAWQQLKVLSPDGCRPFAAGRNGLVLGEGAGIVVLEPLDAALARGTRVHAELAGFGMSADAHDWVLPDVGGMTRCMEAALTDAGAEAQEVAYLNAHATGTGRGDAAEAEAIGRVMGAHARELPVSSTKGLHGHALGASAALELIATALGLAGGWAPPMPDSASDPDVALRLVRGAPVPLAGDVALSSSFGFGGLNAALVLRRISS